MQAAHPVARTLTHAGVRSIFTYSQPGSPYATHFALMLWLPFHFARATPRLLIFRVCLIENVIHFTNLLHTSGRLIEGISLFFLGGPDSSAHTHIHINIAAKKTLKL